MSATRPKPDYIRPLTPAASEDSINSTLTGNRVPEMPRAGHLWLIPAPVQPKHSAATLVGTDWTTKGRLYLSLMKPITWVPVMWSFLCGAAGAGGFSFTWENSLRLAVGLLLAGPLLCGMSQVINDYFDREVDAVNEPWRALPSGRVTLREAQSVIAILGFIGLLVAYWLNPVVLGLGLLGIFLAHNYSAPPLRLKRYTWPGPLASALSYIFIPWLAAAGTFGGVTLRALVLAALYTLGAVGIMVLNDFKSIRGDDELHLASVPVVFGMLPAARIACFLMDGAQFAVIGFLLWEGHFITAAIVALLLLPQGILQHKFIEKPLSRAIWYNARGQNFLVLGMLVASWLIF